MGFAGLTAKLRFRSISTSSRKDVTLQERRRKSRYILKERKKRESTRLYIVYSRYRGDKIDFHLIAISIAHTSISHGLKSLDAARDKSLGKWPGLFTQRVVVSRHVAHCVSLELCALNPYFSQRIAHHHLRGDDGETSRAVSIAASKTDRLRGIDDERREQSR